ncbi:MAG: uracil-DNA glycosylase [Verrucomicrobia bacterium]|nr:uracil-DNA glycosylase [Verrucomicrobiota bacterium]
MSMKLEKSWHEKLQNEISKPYIQDLKNFLEEEKKAGKTIYPPEPLVFNAFLQTPFEKVKVVILGQDPYHGPGQAHGLSFSVLPGVTPPPSLKNIYKELENDVGIPRPTHGCLISWAQQGVLLLNATLTVRAGEPRSHYGKGWERFTDAVIDVLTQRQDPLVFLLWGKSAQEKGHRVLGTHHAVFESAHPSPYSADRFFGCRHFSKTNEFLKKKGKEPINWAVG